MIIGVSGTLGSGKDTVAKIIEASGFEHISTADILRDEAQKLGRPIDRETLRQTGNELRAKQGSGILAKYALKRRVKDNVVISGVRSKGEVDILKAEKSCLIFVDAPIKLRFERVKGRNRNIEDNTNFESFKESEVLEQSSQNADSQNLSYCKEKADYILTNDGSLSDLNQKTKDILTKMDKIK